ncbi:MAG TPA: fasciclin domain-containing protein [Terriglobales bacterium]|nr:fasciclin domain-containing protein [Terriglobales bacterium]
MNNKKPIYLLFAIVVLGISSLLAGDKTEMVPTKTIMQNTSNAAELSTLVSAIKAAGLEQLLEGPGPYTLFAPNNEAFSELPKGTLENLMKPENKAKLKAVLEMHLVQGKWTTADLKKKIEEGKGMAELTCMTGEKLHIADHGGRMLMVKDNDDDIGMFLVSDQLQSNGVVHVIDNVLSPKE